MFIDSLVTSRKINHSDSVEYASDIPQEVDFKLKQFEKTLQIDDFEIQRLYGFLR